MNSAGNASADEAVMHEQDGGYYAVIFTSRRTPGDNGYSEAAERMEALARQQSGFLGMESARDAIGITISYWRDLESIAGWKRNLSHVEVQRSGRSTWYERYQVRIARVERTYSWSNQLGGAR